MTRPLFRGKITRTSLPRIIDIMSWGTIKAGDELQAKGHDEKAVLLENGNVKTDHGEESLQM